MKEKFIQLLRSTHREGIEGVIDWLERSDFFVAPASTVFHGNHKGGLLEHSMTVALLANDVLDMLLLRKPELEASVSHESLVISALLHDICKANIYKDTQKKRKNEFGLWESYDTYTIDYSELPVGHGEKSVILLLQLGLKMTKDEILAIRWHMNAWDLPFQSNEAKSNFNEAKNQCPLLSILQTADGLASSIHHV